MTLQEFTNWANGQSLGKHQGGFVGQCVSLINQYCWRVLNVPADAWGNAKDWASNGNVLKYFTRVSTPQRGDVLVYPATPTNPDGHIELYLGNGQSLQQNRKLDGKTSVLPMWPGYFAVLRPNNFNEGEQMETSAPVFNAAYYLQQNPDVAKAGVDPTQHWLKNGIKEGRKSAPNFHVSEYINNYADLKKAFGTDYGAGIKHYYQNGIAEGRIGTKWAFDAQQAKDTQLASLSTQVTTLTQSFNELNNKVGLLGETIKLKDTEIADLKAKLALQSGDTELLNGFGEWLKKLIVRLGVK